MYGYSISKGQFSNIGVGSKPQAGTERKLTATTQMSSIYTGSAAIITFYVEPVKLTYGHQAINAQSDTQTVDINIPSNQRLLKDFNVTKKDENYKTRKPLEFPDFYDESAGRCYIPESATYDPDVVEPLESLYKFAWPGYILEKSRVYKTKNGVLGSVIGGTEKEYFEEKKPYTTILEDPSRHFVNERIPSFYSSEERGFASDKHFAYIYNTPTIQIDHLKYTAGKDKKYMTTIDSDGSRPITYTLQIVNEFAYIDSLVTDNVKDVYTMKIRNSQERIENFYYSYPRHDLVQVKVYEVKENGDLNHYITIYEDEVYKPTGSERSYQMKNYEGMYAKYYSESLNSIKKRVEPYLSEKEKDLFNTNKNWKVEFVYDEVERVYIKFKDLRGNSIFIKSGDNYIGEVTDKIPRTGAFTFNADNLGDKGKFVLVKYTRDDNNYVDDLSKAVDTKAIHKVEEVAGNGDEYIIFYYLVGNMITVEYRDKNENPIKDPYITEMPTTGLELEVPEFELYEVIGYKHNPNHNGEKDISGDRIPLTVEDKKILIPNPDETDHHVIIYYESRETLKIEYRDISGDKPIAVPPEYETQTMLKIPEIGINIPVPVVPGYEVRYYLKNDNYNGTDNYIIGTQNTTDGTRPIPVLKNGNNQYIIIYYEKLPEDSKVRVEFREDIPERPEIKNPIELNIPSDEETPIYVPDIPGYDPVDYEKDGTPDLPIPTDKIIEVVGDPDKPIIIIILYKKVEDTPIPDDPTIITPDDNRERVYLNANKIYHEEYSGDVAIPTSEDLYVSGDVYSYRFVSEIDTPEQQKDIKVEVIQEYFVNLDDRTQKGQISTGVMPITLSYKYFDIKEAKLYDLKSLHLENGAIKYYNNYDYDTKTGKGYIEKEANFAIKNKPIPTLVYEDTEDVVKAVAENEVSNARVQITSGNGYTVKYEGGVFKIYIDDVDYYNYEDLAGEGSLKEQLRIEAQAIIEKCTQIKTQKLGIEMDGTYVDIITGKKYHYPERSEALSSTEYYIPYVAGRTPLYSFLEDKDLYVMEQALNKKYDSTFEGNYRMIEAIKDNDELTMSELINQGWFDAKLSVDKIITTPLLVHTPIINKVTLEPSDANKKANQLISNPSDVDYILNLEEKFTITIPNDGIHLGAKGYGGTKAYNHEGLTANGGENDADLALWGFTSRIEPKSADEFATEGILNNRKSEQEAIGPSFAEYKLVRFPYDVYLIGSSEEDGTISKELVKDKKPHLFKANEWYNLYEYVKPSSTSYEFVIPIWVKDATKYANKDGIHVLVVAENCPLDTLKGVLTDDNKLLNVKTLETNKDNKDTTYILRKSYDTYVSGRLYDLQVRDSDDPGYMTKLKAALKGHSDVKNAQELPLAQQGQVAAYNFGLKLGYRFYFDLKTKGISNEEIHITPRIYYVPATGAPTGNEVLSLKDGEISLFYHTKATLNNKLTDSDLNVRMTMANTHGQVNNPGFTQETIAATQIATDLGMRRDFRSQVVIGNLTGALKLVKATQKLPFDNLAQVANVCGFGTDKVSFIESAVESESINDDINVKGPNDIKNATGHWYGEYYLPASTRVYQGSVTSEQVARKQANELTSGYLIVVFEKITTTENADGDTMLSDYLTYDKPDSNSQWIKEGIETARIILPNGKEANIKVPKASMLTEAGPMAIYQVGLRANNDYEVVGTH